MFGNRKVMVEMPAESARAGGGVVYAGFWARFAALVVDSAIVTVVGVALMVVLFMVMGGAGVLIGNIAFFILQLLYWPVMESSARQATFGKQLMGLQVTDLQGNRTSFVKSLLRNLADDPALLGPAEGTDPGRSLDLEALERAFLRLAAGLAPKQRAVFVLPEIEGRETAEIAEALGVTESTVRNHLHQARRILREGIERDYPGLLPRGRGGEGRS